MTDVRFGALQDTTLNRAAYHIGTRVFEMPAKIAQATDRFAANHQGTLAGGLVQRLGNFTHKFVMDYEFRDVTDINIGKKRLFAAPSPPKGAVLLWLFPGTILARAIRAYQRGEENGGDYREVFDVLRRDLLAVTLFVFLMDPLVVRLNKFKQKFDGLEIVERSNNALLTYRQFDNYKLVNKQVLIRLLEEGNGKGLLKAVREMLHERGLEKQVGSTDMAKHVTALKQLFPELVAAHDRKDLAAREKLAGEIINHIKSADALTNEAYEKARLGGTPKMVKQLEKLQGGFEGLVRQYAKTRRLPADMLAFGIVVAVLGFLPVWFNSLWNKKRFEEKIATTGAKPVAPPVPNLTFQAASAPWGNTANPFVPR